jgi:predicted DNA repair protein MutK
VAGASLFTLLDDIASILDDVGTMAQMATEKTAGVLGDDLALNAEQVSGVKAERELPVVFAVAKGSAKNKLILVPAALAISAVVPVAITPLLMVGGLYLCFEGFEKIFHALFHPHDDGAAGVTEQKRDEHAKIKGAIRTDFVLSAEIVTITLGTVAGAPFHKQVIVLVGIAALMTVGVYGLVAGIVKLDDAGLALIRSRANASFVGLRRAVGRGILRAAPLLMKTLSVVGTVAMFLVGGGILMHGIPGAHHVSAGIVTRVLGDDATILRILLSSFLDGLLGLLLGAAAVFAVKLLSRLKGARSSGTSDTESEKG